MKFKNKIHPTTMKHLQSALNLGKVQMDKVNRLSQADKATRDFGSNSERIKMVSEFEEVNNRNLENYMSEGVIDLRPTKGRKFSEWLELNHPEIFETTKIIVGNRTTRFVLDGNDDPIEESP